MACKRPRESCALVYFVDAVARLSPDPQAARHARAALERARAWGEAMVRAELEGLRTEGATAAARFAHLGHSAKRWFARGFQLYLQPNAPDAPAHLHEWRGALPPQLRDQSPHQLRALGATEVERWLPGLRRTRLHADAEREQRDEARAFTTPPKPTAPPPPPRRPPPPPPQPNAARGAARAPSAPLALPPALSALLANPDGRGAGPAPPELSAPSPCMRAQVEALLRAQRILRVWETRAIATLPMRACALQRRLEQRELSALFGGGGGGKVVAHDARMASLGLQRINRGTFNTVWTAGERATGEHGPVAAFPPEVRADFLAKRVVLRAPLGTSRWLTFDELVGEVHNIVFTACCGLGPRVAALAYARKVASCKSRTREGVVLPMYKLFALLERATSNADERFVATVLPSASALHTPYYYSALLVAIHKMSVEGYVHLDATLRNFVDFYPSTLGRTASAFAVKVIDVDPSCFRRLRPAPSADWRGLFLFNLLFVLVSLKVRLAERWDPAQHWRPVAACVEALRAQLPPRGEPGGGLAGALLWRGAFRMEDRFPDIVRGALAGDTDAAATGAADALLRFYLVKQPANEALFNYVDFAAPNAEQARKAAEWYDNVYRAQMLPSMRFFLTRLTHPWPPGAPSPRFVDVAHEFLVTPHHSLREHFTTRVPLSREHHADTPKERVLGLADVGVYRRHGP